MGFCPVSRTLSMAWLSSWKYRGMSCRSSTSQRSLAGRPIAFMIMWPEYSSDSGVELELAPGRDDFPAIGKQVFGPMMARCPPPVERWVTLHPAKSASANKCGASSELPSPIQPICRWCLVPVFIRSICLLVLFWHH